MSKKRIALFVGKLGGGGAERAASSLSLMLSEYFDVYVFVYNLKQCDYEHGGKLIDVSNGAKGFCFKALHTIININNVIRAIKIDLVISFCEFLNKTGFLTPKQKMLARKKLVKYNKQLTVLANA